MSIHFPLSPAILEMIYTKKKQVPPNCYHMRTFPIFLILYLILQTSSKAVVHKMGYTLSWGGDRIT
jgi:hypothetical protein